MNSVLNYIDELMINQPLSSDNKQTQRGGKMEKTKGLGGFPPIYLCDSKREKGSKDDPFAETTDKPKREFSKPKESISIQYIMEERRKKKPFINLR